MVPTIPIRIQEISAIYNNNLIQQQDEDGWENGKGNPERHRKRSGAGEVVEPSNSDPSTAQRE